MNTGKPSTAIRLDRFVRRFLIAEYCGSDLFGGWHLYLRDFRKQQRNRDGGWGWIRGSQIRRYPATYQWLHALLAEVGITINGDGTCDGDGVEQVSQMFPMRTRSWGKQRGCIPVLCDECGRVVRRA